VTRIALLLSLLAALTVAPVAAEHEVYYRYTVVGYVTDAGRPRPRQDVELIRDKTGFSYVTGTDEAGLFVIVARLGDESAGESLTLRVGVVDAPLTAHFDPSNHSDERGTRVDVEGRRFVERPAWFRSTLAKLLGTSRR
jgi:hypothetical protein